MKVDVISKDGKPSGKIELPKCFEEEVREDLIRRAVLSEESKEYQPKGNYRWAGLETSARYIGEKDKYGTSKNRGGSRLPRIINPGGTRGAVRIVPHAVKGRRAHPPKPEKKIEEKINKKEYKKALRSALAATISEEYVKKRGHVFEKLPLIVSEDAESILKTKEALELFSKLSLLDDIELSKERVRERKSKHIKGKKKRRKSVLVVVEEEFKGARNLPGVEVVRVDELKVKNLAPGGHPGRLTVYTAKAIKKLGELYDN